MKNKKIIILVITLIILATAVYFITKRTQTEKRTSRMRAVISKVFVAHRFVIPLIFTVLTSFHHFKIL